MIQWFAYGDRRTYPYSLSFIFDKGSGLHEFTDVETFGNRPVRRVPATLPPESGAYIHFAQDGAHPPGVLRASEPDNGAARRSFADRLCG